MPSILTGPQLAAAALGFVGDYDPTRIPRPELTQAFAAFLRPLTTDAIKPEHVGALITAANDSHERWEHSIDPMESERGSWAKQAEDSWRRVHVIAEAICDGGRPE